LETQLETPRIVINRTVCSACRLCVMACSFEKTKKFNPRSSGIWIESDEIEGKATPHICQQNARACRVDKDGNKSDLPQCIAVCPAANEANPPIYWDGSLSIVKMNPRPECIPCQKCITACRFGSIRFDPSQNTLVKCDLCDGDPECVKVCPTGAIRLTDKD
jgi:carbon-monoxide dehydrogenase iron sulfur subunit